MALRIEDYGVVGDLRTTALVGRDGSVDWLCLPDLDDPACFAALLGDDRHGFWRLAPATEGLCTRRRYRGESLVLETEWETPDGHVRVTDLMPPRRGNPTLVRIVEGLSGRVTVVSETVPRFDHGNVVPWLTDREGTLLGHLGAGTVAAVAGPDTLTLTAPVPQEISLADGAVRSRFDVAAGDRVAFVLTHHRSHDLGPEPCDADQALADTLAFWEDWIGGTRYDGEWPDAVRRSLITLKSLVYDPTGGIAAAATTSLPEQVGGVRNWDYRYCWLRDASFTLLALLSTGHTSEARAWREWLLRAVAGDPARLRIVYGLDGRRRIPEATLDWLPGYEGSAPVRVGNAAAEQLQLDVWGEVLVSLHLARSDGVEDDADTWTLQKALLDFLEGHWDDVDNGLWEVRGPRRAFVHSRVMAWAGVAAMVRAHETAGLDGPVDRWRALRDDIRTDVLRHGYDAERNTFTQFYGSDGLDASLLLLPRVGFLPWTDHRIVGTVDAVQRELSHDGLLLRYRTPADDGVDGLPGDEGTFLVCSFWLVDALHGVGRVAEARALFERLLGLRNDLGLLAEEYDVVAGRQLGNVPQAFSHVGLVNSARILSGDHGPATLLAGMRGQPPR
ncbi:GH15 family glucan-1,4-alpha-glucosidase [Isoptericola jiangsuensis]|uniref:Trehalase n=1 Tax=Isoptericola jiangsuensis TaxID=548579 RepID=A0A2A9EWQ9_9MICO|nr:glycoside hydrolase family 15 protein [Isoptericola jiangsuensis]PFG43016.1 GH15 family glucan-1,4-alpha-glucosidase [Isoptericola jiangsuensis]